jgi:dTMP kinase
MQKGKFIVVEGLDGSGKTTLIENIVNSLNGIVPIKSLIDILPRGKCIRECIGNKEHYGNDLSIALLYLSETTRVKDKIVHYLENGNNVIVDRWFYSTMAYTNNKYIDIIDNVSKYLPNIDMTIYVDVDIDTIVKRLSNKLGEDVFTNKDKLVEMYGIRTWRNHQRRCKNGKCSCQLRSSKIYHNNRKLLRSRELCHVWKSI